MHLASLPLGGVEGELEARGASIVTLTVPFFRHFLYESGLPTRWLQNLLAVFLMVGLLAALVRRNWQALLFALLWLAVPFVVLANLNQPRPFEERYVIFIMPVALLLVGRAVAGAGEWLAALSRRWNRDVIHWVIVLALTIPLVWIWAGRARAYYANNREAGRLEQTLAVIEQHARPADLVVLSPRFFVRPLSVDQVEVLYLTTHPSFDQLDALAAQDGRMWILYTSYPIADVLQEPLDRWLQSNSGRFVRVPIKALNALAFETSSSGETESALKDQIAALEHLARDSAGASEAYQRYGLLADAYEQLADFYAARGEYSLAGTYNQKADEVRAANPLP
jgi:hypothetical protein